MGWFEGIVTYLILWWLIFFMVLPFGVRGQQEEKEGTVMGTVASAPEKPGILKKMAITSGIAFLALALVYLLITSGLISVRPEPGAWAS